jgi:hypothetical protein
LDSGTEGFIGGDFLIKSVNLFESHKLTPVRI